jgi:hypothetical protein
MGIPFTASLHNLIERVSVPLHDLLGIQKSGPLPRHELLWDCYRSGQMDDRGLEQEIEADPAFGEFIAARRLPHN